MQEKHKNPTGLSNLVILTIEHTHILMICDAHTKRTSQKGH
jgi:hypothetical protein